MDIFADKYVNTDVTHGRGYIYDIKYHIVWCTKYRKQLLKDGIADFVKLKLQKICMSLDIILLAYEVMPDHIHVLISSRPQLRPSDIVKNMKGNLARWLFLEYPQLKNELWGGHMWNSGYFIATVSERTEEQVKRYIANQKMNADIK
ncbi:MAG: IS200/IS605 family transposase [Eggerthellaceae bacterium]|nr:IS200/IS605 family transposase [Eggerthellaceae bacterium]